MVTYQNKNFLPTRVYQTMKNVRGVCQGCMTKKIFILHACTRDK